MMITQSNDICIGSHLIGASHKPFIIAEMSGNHNDSLERALAIVDAAAKAGAHALKLQTYTADTMTLNLNRDEFYISNPDSLWKGSSLYQLYQKAHTSWDWHQPIFERCRELGLTCFSTPFDITAVEFLETLDVPAYKIASFEIVDIPLIQKVAATGKPLIMSTGMATIGEVEEAVSAAREAGCQDLILLKCTSSYPAEPTDCHLNTIPHLRDLFGVQVGLSDHTLGVGVAVASVALGATVIEKHFTLSREDGGVDAAFSLEPHEMKQLVEETHRAHLALGRVHYGRTESEQKNLCFRRSLYVAEDIKAGDILTEKNLRAIRPGFGLAPKFYAQVLGKRVSQSVEKGTPFDWQLLTHHDN